MMDRFWDWITSTNTGFIVYWVIGGTIAAVITAFVVTLLINLFR